MVLYFTGTGNSRYIASRIAGATGDTLFCINDRIKAGDTSPVATGARVVIVVPTYAWRIPRLVRRWLMQTELTGAAQAWFVMDCGGAVGNAGRYNRRLCRQKQLAYQGTAQIVMPENYIALFHAPQAEKARRIIARAEPDIDRAIAAIQAGHPLAPRPVTLHDRFLSGLVNPYFYAFIVKAKAFTVSDGCVGCGECARRCPTNNITLKDGRPVWGRHCTHCMACICYCPKEAIEYGEKSVGQPRYHYEAL